MEVIVGMMLMIYLVGVAPADAAENFESEGKSDTFVSAFCKDYYEVHRKYHPGPDECSGQNFAGKSSGTGFNGGSFTPSSD